MLFFPRFLLIFYIFGVAIIICFATSSVFGATLDPNEVETLRKIGTKLGKEWNFIVDPCSGQSGWNTSDPIIVNNVTCDCTISNDNLCYVVGILGSDYNKEEVMVMIKLALLCTNASASVRPAMSSVVSMLEGRVAVMDIPSGPDDPDDEMNVMGMKNPYQLSKELTESQIHSDGPWTAASSSDPPDLYPVDLDSSYLERRD